MTKSSGAAAVKKEKVVPMVKQEEVKEMIRVSLDLVDPNPYNPRTVFDPEKLAELAKSIKESGLIHRPVARKLGDRYQLIVGHRRTEAFKLNGETEIELEIKDMNDEQMALLAITENLQRDDVTAMDEAKAIHTLITKLGMKQSEVALKLGVTQAKVSQSLTLLKLADPLLEMINSGKISPSIGRMIGTLSHEIQIALHEEEELEELTAKDMQVIVNMIKKVEGMLETKDILPDDLITTKFVKFMAKENYIDVYGTYYANTHRYAYIDEWKGFRIWPYSTDVIRDLESTELKQQFQKEYNSLTSSYIEVEFNDIPKEVIQKFLDEHFPIEERPKVEESKTSVQSTEAKTETPKEPVKRETKEEKEKRLAEAQTKSPVPVLSVSEGKTKGERLLQRIQEHQGDAINDKSNRCYNCKWFDPNGESYTSRCKVQVDYHTQFSINQWDRFKIEGEADLFLCNQFKAKEEHAESLKVEGMDVERAMFELLIHQMPELKTLQRLVPEMEGKSKSEIVDIFKNADQKNKAYILSAAAVRLNLMNSGSAKYMLLPNGEQVPTKTAMIVGADDI